MKHPIILILLFLAAPVFGQLPEKYRDMLMQNNPDIAAAREAYKVAQAKVQTAYELPGLQLGAGYFIMPPETRLGPQQFKLSLSQMFPWFGTLSQKEQELMLEARARQYALQDVRQQLLYRATDQWLELYQLMQETGLLQKQLSALQQITDLARQQYENGKGSMADVLRARMRRDELREKLQDLKEERQTQRETLNLLLQRNRDAGIVLETERTALPDSAFSRDSMRARHPRILQAITRQKAAQAGIALQGFRNKPSIGLGTDYVLVGQRTDTDVAGNGRDIIMPMLSLNIPINRKSNQAKVQAAEKQMQQKKQQLTATIQALETAFEKARNRLKDANRQYRLYQNLGSQAERALRIERQAYASASADFRDMIDLQLMHFDYQIKHLRARINAHQAAAELRYLTGEMEF